MAWERRSQRSYYYRKKRKGQRVISEYVGADLSARLISDLDGKEQEHRALVRAEWRERRSEIKKLDAEVELLAMSISGLIHATLLSSGYHIHKGQWRKLRMSNNLNVTIKPEKLLLAAAKLNKSKVSELLDVLEHASKNRSGNEDSNEIQGFLAKNPELWSSFFDLTEVLQRNFITRMMPDKTVQLAVEKNISGIRLEFGYDTAPIMEKLLIENIVMGWLRCQWIESELIQLMGHDERQISIIGFWERRLLISQRRYLSACETLAKIRRLLTKDPTLQLNIASKGGQQVNVASHIVKK